MCGRAVSTDSLGVQRGEMDMSKTLPHPRRHRHHPDLASRLQLLFSFLSCFFLLLLSFFSVVVFVGFFTRTDSIYLGLKRIQHFLVHLLLEYHLQLCDSDL